MFSIKYRFSPVSIFLLLITCVLLNCNQKSIIKDEIIEPKLNTIDDEAIKGTADYSKYVAIGDSYFAGQMNGALYNGGQKNSLPLILSKSFQLVGGGIFNQPDINTDVGFSNLLSASTDGIIKGRTRFVIKGGKITIEEMPDGIYPSDFLGDKTTLNNIAVPYLRSIDINTDGSKLKNPYLSRILNNPTDTYLKRILDSRENTTFYSIWLGIIDLALWAVEGCEGEDASKYPSISERQDKYNASINTLVDVRDFKRNYTLVLRRIFTNASIKGFVVNIPEFTKIPFFNVVKYNSVPIDATLHDSLTKYFSNYNELIDKIEEVKTSLTFIDQSVEDLVSRKVQFTKGSQNKILIKDKELIPLSTIVQTVTNDLASTDSGDPRLNDIVILKNKIGLLDQVRHATESDIILLSAANVIGVPTKGSEALIPGITTPLDPKYVISATENEILKSRISQFNQAIDESISELKLKDQVIIVNATSFLNSFIAKKNSLLSFDPLDGIFATGGTHLNPRGQAILADSILHTLEKKFGGKFPPIDISSYKGNEFPTVE